MNLNQQSAFQVGVPWCVDDSPAEQTTANMVYNFRLFPFGVTVGALTIALVVVIDILEIKRSLVPGVMIMLTFLFFVLYLTSTIETGVILFGPGNNVDKQCRNNINNNPITGQSIATLAWLELNSICEWLSPTHQALRKLTRLQAMDGTLCLLLI